MAAKFPLCPISHFAKITSACTTSSGTSSPSLPALSVYSLTSLSDSVAYRAEAVLLIIRDESESGLGSSGCGTSTRMHSRASRSGEFLACSVEGVGP